MSEIHVIFNSQVERIFPTTVFPICCLCDFRAMTGSKESGTNEW